MLEEIHSLPKLEMMHRKTRYIRDIILLDPVVGKDKVHIRNNE